jgi:hypothetical protein
MTDKYTFKDIQDIDSPIHLAAYSPDDVLMLMNQAYEEGKIYGASTMMVDEQILLLKEENENLKKLLHESRQYLHDFKTRIAHDVATLNRFIQG